MIRGDYARIAKFEEEWRRLKGDPKDGVRRAFARMGVEHHVRRSVDHGSAKAHAVVAAE